MTMDDTAARGLVNELLYGIEFIPDITTPQAAEERARAVTGGRLFIDPPHVYLEAIDAVVASGYAPPQLQRSGEPFDETSVLLFLTAVGEHLRRPAEQDR